MAKVSIEVKGLRELTSRIKRLPKELQREIAAEVQAAAIEVTGLAKRDAPADQAILRSEIIAEQEAELSWSVQSRALHAAYVEFGTRSLVQIPAGLEQVAQAARAKAGASSLSAKEAIFKWCRRQGIDEKLWYPIYIKIMTVGIKPQPYFFKQVAVVEPRLVARVKNIINEERL